MKLLSHNDVGINDSRQITIFVFQNAISLHFYIETRKKTLASHEMRDAWGCRTRGQKDQWFRRECLIFIYLIFDNVISNLTGNATSNIAGNVTANVIGNVTGNVIGNVTGNVTMTLCAL